MFRWITVSWIWTAAILFSLSGILILAALVLFPLNGSPDLLFQFLLGLGLLLVGFVLQVMTVYRLKQRWEARVQDRGAKLELANQRLSAVLQSLPVAVSIADARGRIVEANPMMSVLWGGDLPRIENFQDHSVFKGRWTDSGQPVEVEDWPLVRALQKGERYFGNLVDIERFDGSHATILTGGAPVVDSNQRFLGSVSVALDVTKQRRLEREALEAARASRSKAMETEAVFNALSDAVLVFNPDGKVRQANAHAIALFGFDPLHFNREKIASRLVLRNEHGEPITFEDLPFNRALSGEVLVNQRVTLTNSRRRTYQVLISASPSFLGRELTGVVEVWHDVTERERLMGQLSVEQAREKARAAELEALMEAVPAAVWVAHDPGCQQVTGNRGAYELLDLPYDQDVARNPLAGCSSGGFRVLKDGEELTPDQLPMKRVMREKVQLRDWEAELILRDGTPRHILGNANPLFDEQGQVHGAITTFIDVTDLKLAQTEVQAYAEKLERSNTDLEQFAFVASHDLQEPLRKVRFFGERLKEDLANEISEQERDYVERMLHASRRMQGMISDLLTYSRIATKARPFEPVDLKETARDVISDLEILIMGSGGRVELGDLPVIDADPAQMRQLLQNMISNGLKFRRPDAPPLVRVDCEWVQGQTHREEVILTIRDNGIGFDLKYLERIFKPFERLHGRSEYEGSGMGLAICKKIVERHQGTITAQSEPGAGSTFLIRVPLRQPEAEKRSAHY